jgi:hypothetical protein
MSSVIPQPDRRLGQAVFVSKRTHAGSVQNKKSSSGGFKPEPSGGKHTQKVTARKNQDIALD